MHYKKVVFIVNLFFGGGSLLFLIIGTTFVTFGIWIMVTSLVFSFIFFSNFIIPELLNIAKVFAISRYGSREDNDLLSHFSDLLFGKIFNGRISSQVDIYNEEQMTVFANGLINMFRSDILMEVATYYPEMSEQYWTSLIGSLVRVQKDIMLQVFFPETKGELDAINAVQKLKQHYPFMNENTLKNLIKWWKRFRIKMEWQNRADGMQR